MFQTIINGVPVTIKMNKAGRIDYILVDEYIIFVDHNCDEYGQYHSYKKYITVFYQDTVNSVCERCNTFHGDITSWEEALKELLCWL